MVDFAVAHNAVHTMEDRVELGVVKIQKHYSTSG